MADECENPSRGDEYEDDDEDVEWTLYKARASLFGTLVADMY